jgi:F-type H+-transporting ATPase subunit delta
MLQTKVARRYAKSLLELSREKLVMDAVAEDMRLVLRVCEQNREFTVLMHNPIVSEYIKLNILKKLFTGRISEMTLSFFKILAEKRRETHLQVIAKEFIEQYKVEKGIQTAVITSAAGLDDQLKSKVYKMIKESLKSEIELVEKVDKDLIGGFILRVGDKQYDVSIASELKRLAKEFKSNLYISKN